MPDTIKKGDRVRFRNGRGWCFGRVANINQGMATIATDGGFNINRRLSQLENVVAFRDRILKGEGGYGNP